MEIHGDANDVGDLRNASRDQRVSGSHHATVGHRRLQEPLDVQQRPEVQRPSMVQPRTQLDQDPRIQQLQEMQRQPHEDQSQEIHERCEAPDGGWAWVVAAGVFLISLVVPMLSPSFGILFSRQLLEWRASTTTVAVIYSTFMVVWKLSGVIVGSLAREFGFRGVAMTGTLLTASCLTFSAFATSPELLFLFFSLGCGLGSGLSCVGYLILAQYFQTHRGLANTCLMAGAGLGHIFSPLLIRLLQDQYGFKGATIILGAVILHGFVGATLFHPVEWHNKTSKIKNSSYKTEVVYILIPETMDQEDKSCKANGSNSFNIELGKSKCTKVVPSTQLHNVSGNQNIVKSSHLSKDPDGHSSSDKSEVNLIIQTSSTHDDREVSSSTHDDCEVSSSTQDDREVSSSTQDDCEVSSSTQDDCEVSSSTQDDREVSSSTEDDRQTTTLPPVRGSVCGCVVWCALIRVFRAILDDIRILRNPSCMIIAVASTLIVNGEANFTVLVPFAIQAAGHSLQTAAWCVSVAGVCSFLARMCVSALSDFQWFNMRLCYMAGIATMALSIIVFPMQRSAAGQAAVMGVFGCASGAFYGLNNLLMTEIVGLSNLTAMYGAKNFLVALGFFSVGPLIGVVGDVSGNYAVSMWVLAALMLASFVSWFFMPAAEAYDLRRRSQTTCAGGPRSCNDEKRNRTL